MHQNPFRNGYLKVDLNVKPQFHEDRGRALTWQPVGLGVMKGWRERMGNDSGYNRADRL